MERTVEVIPYLTSLNPCQNIDALRNAARIEAPELPSVTPNQYAGMGISAALEAYLKARPGKKIPINQVVEDLLAGGAVLGAKPKRYVQNVKITVRSRPKLAEWDKDWNVWLAPTASEPKPPRRNKK